MDNSTNTIVTSSVFAGNVDPAPSGESFGPIWGNGTRLAVVNSTFANNAGGGAGANVTFARTSPLDAENRPTTPNRFDNSLARALDEGGAVIDDVLGSNVNELLYRDSSGSGAFGVTGFGVEDREPDFIRLPDSGPDGVWRTADDDYGDLRLQPAPGWHAGSRSLRAVSATAQA